MAKRQKILIVEDDVNYLNSLKASLGRIFEIIDVTNRKEAKKLLFQPWDLVLLDIRLDENDKNNREGMEILTFIKREAPTIPVVMMTAYGDIDLAVEAMKLGAVDFIQKTKTDIEEYRKVIQNALERSRLERKVSLLEEDLHRLESWEIVGDDPKILEIKGLIDKIAEDGQTTVLIRGETGTGKELVARAIHERGIRKKGPFVPVAISALSPTVVESELFGHEKGAFTGADRRKIGYIEKADGGVLFLDEIGELDKEIQLKLLRFLDNNIFCRMGSTDEIKVDIQLIAATNKDLEKAIEDGEFRNDLYYRLEGGAQIFLPSLAERIEDISKLAYHFLSVFRAQGRTKIEKISDAAMQLLKRYDWPGNVRELKHAIEGSIIGSQGVDEILPEHLPEKVRLNRSPFEKKAEAQMNVLLPDEGINIDEVLCQIELSLIEQALKREGGVKERARQLLGYNDYHRMRERIRSAKTRFPSILKDFPYLQEEYKI